jgi:hypothetical protein
MEEGKKERGASKIGGAAQAPSGGTSVGSSMEFGAGPASGSETPSMAGDKPPLHGPGSGMGGGPRGNGDGYGQDELRAGAEDVMETTRGMVGQLFGDVRSAAEEMLEERKGRAAESVQGVAEALRRTADNIENETIARYAEQAADTVARFSETVRERRLGEMIADLDDFARRQPMLFLVGAVAAGFIAGRFMAASAERAEAEAWEGAERRPRTGRTRTAGYGRGGDFGTKGNA